jgi:hypothetical protein
MTQLPSNDDLASLCSPSSSDDGVRGSASGGGRTNEHLMDLLTRPRSRGGYGSRLNYSEFSTLAQSLGWSSEDMDDCWYDIMMGEPSAEAVDMVRVAECVCSYCLASPLPLLEKYNVKGGTAESSSSLSSSPLSPTEEHHECRDAVDATPPRQSASRAACSDNHNTTVLLSPPSPKPPTVTAATPGAPPPSAMQTERAGKKAKPSSTLASPRRAATAFPRYAVETVSSERKRSTATTASPPPLRRPPASPRRSPPPSTNAIFFRLYENGVELQRKRRAAQPAAAAAQEAAEVAACTFRPRIQPYPLKKAREGNGGVELYKKPTQSYFAKLTSDDRGSDPIAQAAETPRVAYHPAPGPSSSVPAGYVEGVARLRRYVASRYQHAALKNSLRDPARNDVCRLVDAPILRLPVTVAGVADTVDVRLASVHSRSPHRQQPSPLLPQQLPRESYADVTEPPTTNFIPHQSPRGVARYKEHSVYY